MILSDKFVQCTIKYSCPTVVLKKKTCDGPGPCMYWKSSSKLNTIIPFNISKMLMNRISCVNPVEITFKIQDKVVL